MDSYCFPSLPPSARRPTRPLVADGSRASRISALRKIARRTERSAHPSAIVRVYNKDKITRRPKVHARRAGDRPKTRVHPRAFRNAVETILLLVYTLVYDRSVLVIVRQVNAPSDMRRAGRISMYRGITHSRQIISSLNYIFPRRAPLAAPFSLRVVRIDEKENRISRAAARASPLCGSPARRADHGFLREEAASGRTSVFNCARLAGDRSSPDVPDFRTARFLPRRHRELSLPLAEAGAPGWPPSGGSWGHPYGVAGESEARVRRRAADKRGTAVENGTAGERPRLAVRHGRLGISLLAAERLTFFQRSHATQYTGRR